MESCSICRKLSIVPGDMDDYRQLEHYHYRGGRLGPVAAVFALKPKVRLGTTGTKALGVIVYTMPAAACELRNIATSDFFAGFDRRTRLALINKNIRCIGRVIIDPRVRSLGLAARLVRETIPQMNVPIIEALAVMGQVNPFFEHAGMKAYCAKPALRHAELIEAFGVVGIAEDELIDAELVDGKLAALRWPAADLSASCMADFIKGRIRRFLQTYGRRRDMPAGLERTKFVLSKLTDRPVYYIWFNPAMNEEGTSNIENQISK